MPKICFTGEIWPRVVTISLSDHPIAHWNAFNASHLPDAPTTSEPPVMIIATTPDALR
jgi:hypothetical protein